MKDEYIIINATAIQKRIEELEDDLKTLGDTYEEEIHAHGFMSGEIVQLKKILSQSTPLIPEIEKAFISGCQSERRFTKRIDEIKDYISNLKLDI